MAGIRQNSVCLAEGGLKTFASERRHLRQPSWKTRNLSCRSDCRQALLVKKDAKTSSRDNLEADLVLGNYYLLNIYSNCGRQANV